jgi:hypothetical protein
MFLTMPSTEFQTPIIVEPVFLEVTDMVCVVEAHFVTNHLALNSNF